MIGSIKLRINHLKILCKISKFKFEFQNSWNSFENSLIKLFNFKLVPISYVEYL
jgi:hypothetical protein